MVSPQTVYDKIIKMREYKKELLNLADVKKTTFLEDKIRLNAAKYLLQVGIECCIDIAHHIIASEKFRKPQNYYDSFQILAEHKIVPQKLLPRLKQMVGFRNRLVHMYWEVDNEMIYRVIHDDLSDFDQFVKCILYYMDKHK